MIEKIKSHYPIFNRNYDFNAEELSSLELSGRTTQKVNELVDLYNAINVSGKEDADNITKKRKLSPTGDFTGTLFGRLVSAVLTQIDSNSDKISYLANQFADGQTGFVIDGGFFESSGIDKNYNGGTF